MSNGQMLNLGPTPAQKPEAESSQVVDGSRQSADWSEDTRTDLRRIRMTIARQEDAQEAHQRRTKVLSIILGVLLIGLAGAIWFAYPVLKEQRQAIAELTGVHGIAESMGDRLNMVETNLTKMTGGLPALATRMGQLQANMKTNLQVARKEAETMTNQLGQRLRQEMSQNLQAIQSRLTGVESNQKESAERVNQLQQQVVGLQRELATMREEATIATERLKALSDAQQTSRSELVSLNDRMGANQTALGVLSNRVDRERIEFQVSNKQSVQIGPGILFSVTRVNNGKQELDGIIQLGSDGADALKLPIHAQGIQKPFLFYTADENRPMELVITQIAKTGVSGYLMKSASMKPAAQ